MTTTFKHVIFDIGGVLLEWDPPKFLKELQFPAHFNDVFQSLLWAMHDGGLVTREEIADKLPLSIDKELFSRCVEKIAPALKPIDEMIALFHQIRNRGYGIYILSNMPREMHEELLQLHDFFRYPQGQVYSYQVKAIKPQPQIYQSLMSDYQLDPAQSLFIDDREENILAAQKLGIDGIVCKAPSQVRAALLQRQIII